MNINRAGITVIIKAPDLIKQLIPRINAVGIACQMVNQFKLFRRRINFNTVNLKLVISKINAKLVISYLAYLGALVTVVRSAKHCFYAGDYLLGIKRLAYIIVRTQFKTENLIKGFALCGQHYNGSFARLADFPADLPAVQLRKHYIK